MINEDLKTFISKMRAAGKTDSEITAELKTAGWGEADITLALNPSPILAVDSQPPVRTDSKSRRSIWIWFALIIATIFALIILVTVFVRTKKSQINTGFSSTLVNPTPTVTGQRQQNLDVALQVAAELNKDLDPNVSLVSYSDVGLTINIPSHWQRIESESPKGQLFSNSLNSVIIATHAGGKQCFLTLTSFVSGIESLGGYDISTQTESVIKGLTVYNITAKIKGSDGKALHIRNMLFKGEINNYEVTILTNPDYLVSEELLSKIVDSVVIYEDSLTAKAIACK